MYIHHLSVFVRPPGFIDNIQSEATHSRIKISWSAPTTSSGELLAVDHYLVSYISVRQETSESFQFVRGSMETDFNMSNLASYTFVLFTIEAVYQGMIGPGVCIGISTGNLYRMLICILIYKLSALGHVINSPALTPVFLLTL